MYGGWWVDSEDALKAVAWLDSKRYVDEIQR